MKRKTWVLESELSERTGISRTSLAHFRKRKIPRSEWKKGTGKGRPVLYSEAAVLRVKAVFGIQETELAGESTKGSSESQPARDPKQDTPSDDRYILSGQRVGKCDPPPLAGEFPALGPRFAPIQALPDLKLLTVSKLVPNKRILFARNGGNEVFQVIVPSSLVWAQGDPLRVKESQTHKGYYELVGRAPRWRGDRIYRHEFV